MKIDQVKLGAELGFGSDRPGGDRIHVRVLAIEWTERHYHGRRRSRRVRVVALEDAPAETWRRWSPKAGEEELVEAVDLCEWAPCAELRGQTLAVENALLALRSAFAMVPELGTGEISERIPQWSRVRGGYDGQVAVELSPAAAHVLAALVRAAPVRALP